MSIIKYKLLIISALVFISFRSDAQDDGITNAMGDSLHLYADTFDGLNALDSLVGEYKVFFNGENHLFTESNARLWLKMIKYLHAKANVRNILFEYGHSYGCLVNEYIQTGDSNLYNAIENFGYIQYSRAIRDLMTWNRSLDSSERVRFVAIDIDRGVYPMLKLLDHLIPEDFVAHDSIILHLETIRSLAAYNQKKLYQQENDGYTEFDYQTSSSLDLVQKNFLRFEDEYRKVLGPRFSLFKEIMVHRLNIRKIYLDYETSSAAQEYVYREMHMHKEFLVNADTLDGAWFGQFGRCHTTQTRVNSNSCEWFMFRSLANRIRNTEGGAYANCVLTMAILYNGDRTLGAEFEENERLFDPYFEQMDPNRVVLLDFSRDTTLDSLIGEDFDYVFLNTYGLDNETKSFIYDYDPEDFGYGRFRFRMGPTFGVRQLDLGSLNALLASAGEGGEFDPQRNAIGFEMEWGNSSGKGHFPLMTSVSFAAFTPDTLHSSMHEHVQLVLSGFQVGTDYRYNLIRSDRFELGPGLGFYFDQLRFKIFETDTTGSASVFDGFLGPDRSSVYSNPAFSTNLSAFMGVNLGWFYLRADVGKAFDLSNKHWTLDGKAIENGVKTSLSGIYYRVSLGLSITD